MRKQAEFFWFGQTWTCNRVISKGDLLGGECSIYEKKVNINAKYNIETFLDYLHHELMEGAIFLSGCGYSRQYPDKEEIFMMNHTQMDLISSGVRGAYDKVKHGILTKQELIKNNTK